jgi:hypothetical protein
MTTAVSKGTGLPSFSGSFKAYDAGLDTMQFHAAYLTSSGIVDWSTAATTLSIGIINNKPYAAVGAVVEVIMMGEAKAKLGGTVAAGQFLAPNNEGELVAIVVGTTTSNIAVARALEDGQDHDIIRVFVLPGFFQV